MEGSLRRKARAVARELEAFAALTRGFSERAGLACAPGCGACCTYPHIEATPLEMLPSAVAILDEGKVDEWLERLAARERVAPGSSPSPCSFFDPIAASSGATTGTANGAGGGSYLRGRCGRYEGRPLVCRLFGSGVRRGAEGRREVLACRVMKELEPGLAPRVGAALADPGFAAPEAVPAFEVLYGIDPALATERLPIDRALERALLMVALEDFFSRAQDAGEQPPCAMESGFVAVEGSGSP